MNKKYYVIFTSLLAVSAPIWADDNGNAEGEDSGKTIVITATRTSETIDETLAPVTVFTRADIEASQAQTLPELLQSVPGVQFIQAGSRGAYTSMFIRGTNTSQSLILIDGVRSSNTLGSSDIQYIDLNQVERIEVVRGSRSSLYGADAIGGVIQIFTKKGSSAQMFVPVVKAGYGSHDAFQGSVGVGGTIENTQYNITSSYERTDGFDTTGGTSPNTLDNDDDAFRNHADSINITQHFSQNTSLNVIYNRSEGSNQYDDRWNFSQNTHADFDIQKISSAFKTAVNNIWNITVSAAQFENNQTVRDSFPSEFDMQRDSANWQNDISITDNQLVTVGIDYYDDHGKIAPAFSLIQKQSLGNTAYFAQDQFSLVDNDFIIGLRRDNNYQYGDHNTGDFSWGRNLTKTLRMTASYGKGFRAPTFTDLYYPVFSNPNLDPEKSNSYEIGLKGNQQTFDWEANVYQIDIKDLIQWNSTLMMPDNLNKAQIQGLELASHAHIGPWRFGGNVTFLNPRDENTGYVLVGRAKRTLNLEVDRTFGKFDFGVSLIAQSQRYDDAANTETLSGYGSVDVRGTYHVTSEFDVQLKVSNIFDRNYIVGIDNDPVFGYGDIHQDGTNAFLTVTYTPHVK